MIGLMNTLYTSSQLKECEYIEATEKGPYINTMYIPNGKTTVEFKCDYGEGPAYGIEDYRVDLGTWVWYSHASYMFDYNGDRLRNCGIISGLHTYKDDKGTSYIDGVKKGSIAEADYQCEHYMFIFGKNTRKNHILLLYDKYQLMAGKMYYFKIWNDGTLVRDYIPMYDPNKDEFGFLDIVHDTWYGSHNPQCKFSGAVVGGVIVKFLSAVILYLAYARGSTTSTAGRCYTATYETNKENNLTFKKIKNEKVIEDLEQGNRMAVRIRK